MPYKNIHRRRSIRLKGYDYSRAGLYFITICVQDRRCLFGKIVNGEMILNDAGKMVENEWLKIPGRFTNVQLHEFVVMPNHFHSVMEIVGATLVVAPNDETFSVAPNNETFSVAPNDETFNENISDENISNENISDENISNENISDENISDENISNENISDENISNENISNIFLGNDKGQPQGIAPTHAKTVGDMVGAFQSIVTVEYIRGVKQLGWQSFNKKLWQRNYWEHIIRNERSYQRISEYIMNNPKNWKQDKFYN